MSVDGIKRVGDMLKTLTWTLVQALVLVDVNHRPEPRDRKKAALTQMVFGFLVLNITVCDSV